MNPNDKLFRDMAALYIEEEAAALRLEMEKLPEEETASLDRRVRREVTRLKLRPYVRPLILVAACAVLVLLLPQGMKRQEHLSSGAEPMQNAAPEAAPDAREFAPFAAALDEDAPEEEVAAPNEGALSGGGPENPATAGPGTRANPIVGGASPEDAPNAPTGGGEASVDSYADSGNLSQSSDDTGGAASALGGEAGMMSGAASAAVPITFALPGGFDVVGYEEDNGKSIYRLRHQSGADVVMVLEESGQAPVLPELDVMMLAGREVYYKYSPDYSQIIFEQDGILYDLTCQGEMSPLIALGEAIV